MGDLTVGGEIGITVTVPTVAAKQSTTVSLPSRARYDLSVGSRWSSVGEGQYFLADALFWRLETPTSYHSQCFVESRPVQSMRVSELSKAYQQLAAIDSGQLVLHDALEPANVTARFGARRLLDHIDEVHPVPHRVMPSIEGGVAVIFVQRTRYAEVEFYNTGEIIVTLRGRGQPDVFPAHATALKRTLDKISAHLR